MSDKEIPAFICSDVFNKMRPVLLVSRADGDWQLLCGGEHAKDEKPHVVGLNHLLEDDPSLSEILDLPPEWIAEREFVGATWKRLPIDPVH